MQDVTIPALGMAMTGAVLTRWYKEPGEVVAAGEVIAEIETDKSAVDLESPAAGVLGPHLVAEGTEVPVGGAVTRVLDSASDDVPATAGAAPAHGAGAQATAPAPQAPATVPTGAPGADPEGGSTPPAPSGRAPHKLSPRKRMAARLAAEEAAAAPEVPGLAGRRGAVAQAVAESWRTIPHFSVQREIDCSEADASLAELRARVPDASYTDLLLRAFALAVGTVMESAGDLGLAVATPGGVMMPVVPEVPALDAADLVAARIAAARRGREGRLTERDLASSALAAVSNLGPRGVDAFTGIVPAGRRLLLTAGRIAARPVAIDGRLAVRPTMIATLNVDHRYLDGDRAADVLDAFDREFRALGTWAGKGNQ